MNANYQTFITRLMATTGLPLNQMQTQTEWLENRKRDFDNNATESELKKGFQQWLDNQY